MKDQIVQTTLDAINTMVKQQADPSYYLAHNAYTGKHRVFGDVADSHYESSLFAILSFEDEHLHVSLMDCGYRDFLYADPDYIPLVLGCLHPGSKLIGLD